jgi:hypothetical protein
MPNERMNMQDERERYKELLRMLDREEPWDGPASMWGQTYNGDIAYIVKLFEVPHPERLPEIATRWRESGRTYLGAWYERLTLTVSALRGNTEEQWVVRDAMVISRDAEFFILRMHHDTKEITEADAFDEESPLTEGLRLIAAAAWTD